MAESSRIVATDTSVLVNFIHVGRLDILGALKPWAFAIPEQVEREITRPEQATTLAQAVGQGYFRRETITDPRELDRYGQLLEARIGKGEAACAAMAEVRGWTVASDERGRFLRLARERLGAGRLVNTPGLLLLAIRRGVISVDEADRLKASLDANRFRMAFRSFRDLLKGR